MQNSHSFKETYKSRFPRIYLIYLLVLFSLSGIFLVYVYNVLADYEDTQVEAYLTDLVASFEEDTSLITSHTDFSSFEVGRFDSESLYYDAFVRSLYNASLSFTADKNSYDEMNPQYFLLADNKVIAKLYLSAVNTKTKLGIITLSDWTLNKIVPIVTMTAYEYIVTVPTGYRVMVNGLLLSDKEQIVTDAVQPSDDVCSYYFTKLSAVPEIIIYNRHNKPIDYTLTEGVIFVKQYDYSLSVSHSFTVFPSSAATVKTDAADGTARYVLETNSPASFEISDAFGNNAVYEETGTHSVPAYRYTVCVPENYSVTVNQTLLTAVNASVSYETVKAKQYLENMSVKDDLLPATQMATYSFETLLPSEISIYTPDGVPVTPIPDESGYHYSVPLFDYTITIPSNFEIYCNGTLLTNELVTAAEDIEAYQYINEYHTMPKKLTYSVNGLLNEPTFLILDNFSEPVAFTEENGIITITNQSSRRDVPDELNNEIDVLSVARLYSLFYSTDLQGKRYGFYTIADYFIKNSFYYNGLYAYATSIDITFFSEHKLDTPAFTDEFVTNYIRYDENCFSCDIHLKKHMLLMSNGVLLAGDNKYRTDSFYKTFYFVNYDDTDDGVSNPRWLIADLCDILE